MAIWSYCWPCSVGEARNKHTLAFVGWVMPQAHQNENFSQLGSVHKEHFYLHCLAPKNWAWKDRCVWDLLFFVLLKSSWLGGWGRVLQIHLSKLTQRREIIGLKQVPDDWWHVYTLFQHISKQWPFHYSPSIYTPSWTFVLLYLSPLPKPGICLLLLSSHLRHRMLISGTLLVYQNNILLCCESIPLASSVLN